MKLLTMTRSMICTPDMVKELASRPAVQKSITNPRHPHSVLSFFYGFDTQCSITSSRLNDSSLMSEMSNFWFLGHFTYDKLCRNFSTVIHEAGRNQLLSTEWDSVDGKIARIILCDQMARNCFRGTKDAFAYDNVSLSIAVELSHIATTNKPMSQEINAAYVNFIVLPMMHSESLETHAMISGFLTWAEQNPRFSRFSFNSLKYYSKDHTNVIKKFGRYPHRNNKLGRVNTAEEEDWLKSKDIPGWAKSQG